MPWKCNLCEGDPAFETKGKVKEHVRENHIEALVEASIRFDESDENEDFIPSRIRMRDDDN